MNELTLDGQIYLSSKQAAEITGYAKDYIGQLCREGRVPARLVGRSWYILKLGLDEHRFGTNIHQEAQKSSETDPEEAQPLIYESEQDAPKVPFIPVSSMQSAWEEWFNSIKQDEELALESPSVEDTSKVESVTSNTAVDLKLTKIYKAPILQINREIKNLVQPRYSVSKAYFIIESVPVSALFSLIALVMCSVALIGTGFAYQEGISQGIFRSLAGVAIYSKTTTTDLPK